MSEAATAPPPHVPEAKPSRLPRLDALNHERVSPSVPQQEAKKSDSPPPGKATRKSRRGSVDDYFIADLEAAKSDLVQAQAPKVAKDMLSPRTKQKVETLSRGDGAPSIEADGAFYRQIVTEFFGTLMLVFMITATIILSGLDKDVYQGALTKLPAMSPSRHFLISLSAGMSYTVLTYCTLSISGGHMNPAITFARCALGRFPWSKGVLYFFAQFLGGMFGAGMTRMCVPRIPDVYANFGGALNGPYAKNWYMGESTSFGVEMLVTMVYVFVYFSATSKFQNKTISHAGPLAPLAIGLAAFIAHLIALPVTLCSMNPVRSIGAAIMVGNGDSLAVFIFAPLLGGLIGGGLYEYGVGDSDEHDVRDIKAE